MAFLCKIIGHDWEWSDRAEVTNARIDITYHGQHRNDPALMRITHFTTYLRNCRRKCVATKVTELSERTKEEWAR